MYQHFLRFPPISVLAFLVGVGYGQSPNCCAQLSQIVPEKVFAPNSSMYITENQNYWSFTESFFTPSCIFMPNSTQDISKAVRLFSDNSCTFAIKGQGHSSLPGAANIDNGVTINTNNLSQIAIDFQGGTVRVGAGNTLGDVYRALDPYNISAVIGRYDKVGFGLAVAAGLSFFNNRDGLAIDNVLSYEAVLANGTVINTSTENYPDLHWALKGGNNNFAVVSSYLLRTFQTPGGVYGGLMYYNESSLDQIGDVIYEYHSRWAIEDVLTHTLPQYGFNGTTNETINFSPVVYNAKVDQLPPSLAGWGQTPHYKSTLRYTNYSDLAVEYNAGFPDGEVQEQRVFTVYADKAFFKDVWQRFQVFLQNYRDVPGFYGLHCNMPVTPRARAEGFAKGHNALGFEGAKNQTLSILYFGVTFNNREDSERVLTDHQAFVNSMRALAEQRGVLHRYIMLTYAGNGQPVIEGYGPESVSKLKAVQAAYDPTFVFQTLVTGGQKLPVAGTF